MRKRLILLAIVGAASATAVAGAVVSAMPRATSTIQVSPLEEASARMPGVALDEEAAAVQRFLGYENAPVPEPTQPPVVPFAPRYRGFDTGPSDTGSSGGSSGTGSSETGATPSPAPTPTPSPSTPTPTPTPTPTLTPSPDPTNGGSTPGGGPTSPPTDPGLTSPGLRPTYPSAPPADGSIQLD